MVSARLRLPEAESAEGPSDERGILCPARCRPELPDAAFAVAEGTGSNRVSAWVTGRSHATATTGRPAYICFLAALTVGS